MTEEKLSTEEVIEIFNQLRQKYGDNRFLLAKAPEPLPGFKEVPVLAWVILDFLDHAEKDGYPFNIALLSESIFVFEKFFCKPQLTWGVAWSVISTEIEHWVTELIEKGLIVVKEDEYLNEVLISKVRINPINEETKIFQKLIKEVIETMNKTKDQRDLIVRLFFDIYEEYD